jgi:spore coat protein U-like protein
MKRRDVFLLLALMPWAGLHAQSQTATTTFRVQARVNAVCVVSASDLDFGAYSSQSGTALTGTTMLQATCTPSTTYNIALNKGTTAGGTINQRKLASGSNTLNYQLYSNAARTSIWGETVGTDTVTGSGTGLQQNHTVYGSVPAAQLVPAGSYADTITVTIIY